MNDIKRLRRKDVKKYCQKICDYLNRTERMSATYTYFLRSSGTLEDRNVPIYVDYYVRFTKANAFCVDNSIRLLKIIIVKFLFIPIL